MSKVITFNPDAVEFVDPVPASTGVHLRGPSDFTMRIVARCKANPGKWLPISTGPHPIGGRGKTLSKYGLKVVTRTTRANGTKTVTTYAYLPA